MSAIYDEETLYQNLTNLSITQCIHTISQYPKLPQSNEIITSEHSVGFIVHSLVFIQ